MDSFFVEVGVVLNLDGMEERDGLCWILFHEGEGDHQEQDAAPHDIKPILALKRSEKMPA